MTNRRENREHTVRWILVNEGKPKDNAYLTLLGNIPRLRVYPGYLGSRLERGAASPSRKSMVYNAPKSLLSKRWKTPETKVSPKMKVSKTMLENHPSGCCSLVTGVINGRDLGSHEVHKYGGIWMLRQFVVTAVTVKTQRTAPTQVCGPTVICAKEG